MNSHKDAIHKDIIYFEVSDQEKEVEVALQYTSYSETVLSFANIINTT